MGYRVKPFTMSVRNNSTQEFIDVGLLGSDVDAEIEEFREKVEEIEKTLSVNTYKYLNGGELGGAYCRIPFGEHSEHALLCGGDIRPQGLTDQEAIQIAISKSSDLGKTWTKQIVLTRPTTYSNSRVMDGCIAVDRSNNRIFVFGHWIDSNEDWPTQTAVGINTDCVYRYSDDDGDTWSEQYSLRSILGNGSGNIITCFAGVGKGIYTSDGYIVIPYVEKTTSLVSTGIFYSTDHGSTWIKTSNVGFDANEPQVIEYDGYLYLNCRNIMGARSMYRTSDYGSTWEYMPNMSTLIQPFTGVCCGFESYDQEFGKVFIYSGCDNKAARGDIVIKQSRDLIHWKNIYPLRKAVNGANGYTSLTSYDNSIYCVSEYEGDLYVTIFPKASATLTDSDSLLTVYGNSSRPANLNNYTAEGVYTIDQGVTASTGTNFPESQGGMLYVTARPWELQVYQKYTTFNGISYERVLQYSGSGSTWSKWRRVTLGAYESGSLSLTFGYETQTTAPTVSVIQSAYQKYGPFVNFFWRGKITNPGVGSSLIAVLPWTIPQRTMVMIAGNNANQKYQSFAINKNVYIRKPDWSAVANTDLNTDEEIVISGTIFVNE